MVANEQTRALPKLLAWMKKHKKRANWLAAACGVKPPSVHCWTTGETRPKHYVREVIAVLTNGEVPVSDWELPSERAKRTAAIRKIQSESDA